MRIVIVYESVFGNTRVIAESIAAGLRTAEPTAEVVCANVGEVRPRSANDADLLIVGGPTHMRGMTTGLSRRMGVEAESKNATDFHPEPDAATRPGLREWFHDLPRAPHGTRGAAFDTRVAGRMAGGAARGIARRLERHGYTLVAEPEGFIVEDIEGPLSRDERDRATAWAARLLRSLVPVAP